MRGPSVDVFVGPIRAQFSVPKNLLLHYSKLARRTFVQHGGDMHFKEFEESALYLPEHAPETFEFILKWMYQGHLGITEYCKEIFATHELDQEALDASFLLICRVYILADYLDIGQIMQTVIDDLYDIQVSDMDDKLSPIGPDAVKTVLRNTHEDSQLQIYVLNNLTDSLVSNTNGRPIEEYSECFTAIEGFGPMITQRVLDSSVNLYRNRR